MQLNKGISMKKIFTFIIMSILLSSCAGVIKGTDQTVSFTSEPSGAEVIIDGMSMGTTPFSAKLKKNKFSTVMIKLNGYRTVSRPIEKSYDPTAMLNVFWDLSTTDMITGAAYEYSPNTYYFKLESEVKTVSKWIPKYDWMKNNANLALREFVLMYYFEIKNDFLISKETYITTLNEYLKNKKSKLSSKDNLRFMFLNTKDAYSAILEFQRNGYWVYHIQ
jgi:hypothetical protein